MSRWFLLFLLLCLTACSPGVQQAEVPSPSADPSSTPVIRPTATRTGIPTSTPTPLGGSESLLLLDGPSLIRLDLSTHSESRVADLDDLLPAGLSFDPQNNFYSGQFSPDAGTVDLVLHDYANETGIYAAP